MKQRVGVKPRIKRTSLATLGWMLGSMAPATLAVAPPVGDDLPRVRSKRFEITYELDRPDLPLTQVQLWFTIDLGETWHNYGTDGDKTSPVEFIAPNEGIYGFYLLIQNGAGASGQPPGFGTEPQQWAFVDYTPPLAQLHYAKFENDDPSTGTVHIRWTAFDQFASKRPITLTFQRAGDVTWLPLYGPMPNIGRYDWILPAKLQGDIRIKLSVVDRAGHLVERVSDALTIPGGGAISISSEDQEANLATTTLTNARALSESPDLPGGHASPYQVAATQPTAREIQQAEQLYQRGSYHLVRQEYELAAERFTEALERNPHHLQASYDLAGIHLLQKRYDHATEIYQQIVQQSPDHRDALWGMALASWSKHRYASAADALRKILDKNNHDAPAWLKLGDVDWQMGRRAEARNNWMNALQAPKAESKILDKAKSRLAKFTLVDP
jgi:Tfp pilus assembly protein PilF